MRVEVRRNRRYEEQFRQDALRLVARGDRSMRQIAIDLGIPYFTLHGWSKMGRQRKGPKTAPARGVAAEETSEQRLARVERENAALRKENESLKMDREILKKAAAFFVKESE